jgi:TonB family protein
MTNFVNYLLESGISLSLFALVYFLFLRRETFFNINRWFLLISVVFSALLPLLHIPFYSSEANMLSEVTVTPYINLLSTVTIYSTELTTGAERFVLTYSMIGYFYLLGVVFLSGKLLFQIFQIYRLISNNQVFMEGKLRMVILEREISPFSFLNYIFVSNQLQQTPGWEKMLEHEKQHVRQGHTFDVLVLEIVAVFQWFNPFFWMFRSALRENHEFLADQAVISKGTAPTWYKQILINQYVGDQIVLANNFNSSLIKNRIQMISKIKSRKMANIKILIGFVLAASLIAVFACEQKKSEKAEVVATGKTVTIIADGKPLQITGDDAGIEKLKSVILSSGQFELKPDSTTGQLTIVNQEEVYTVVEQMPEFPGGETALPAYLGKEIKYPDEAIKKGIQGKVFVTFVVGSDGTVKNAKVVRGVDPMLDAEALRVINTMPKWTPGKQSGKDVAVQFTIPINFKLQ